VLFFRVDGIRRLEYETGRAERVQPVLDTLALRETRVAHWRRAVDQRHGPVRRLRTDGIRGKTTTLRDMDRLGEARCATRGDRLDRVARRRHRPHGLDDPAHRERRGIDRPTASPRRSGRRHQDSASRRARAVPIRAPCPTCREPVARPAAAAVTPCAPRSESARRPPRRSRLSPRRRKPDSCDWSPPFARGRGDVERNAPSSVGHGVEGRQRGKLRPQTRIPRRRMAGRNRDAVRRPPWPPFGGGNPRPPRAARTRY